MDGVELSLTCWERTYREVLCAEFIREAVRAHCFEFSKVVVVINNVDDPADAVSRAKSLVRSGDITEFWSVSERLASALKVCGLSQRRLGSLAHYTDHLLVAVAGEGPRFLLHSDTDARLVEPTNWVGPSVELLKSRSDVLVAQPSWTDTWSVDAERLLVEGDFDLGYGFTDHVFLVERSRLAAPIYRYVAPASWWYSTSHISPIFEQRVDAYMRRQRLLRAVFRGATYVHEGPMAEQPASTLYQRFARRGKGELRQGLEFVLPRFSPVWVRRPGTRDTRW